jgi:hypothetical protein
MKRNCVKIFVLFFGFVFCTYHSTFAQQTKVEKLEVKVRKLQKEVSQLKNRITRIEKLLSSSRTAGSYSQRKTNSKRWKNKKNWRKLKKGMSKAKVKQLLGSPGKISTHSYGTIWYYPDVLGGSVNFENGRVDGWSEP